MNFKSPYPWAEPGRLCWAGFIDKKLEDIEINENPYEPRKIKIIEYNFENDRNWCLCERLDNNKKYYYLVNSLKPIYTIEEIMQYADKTIIEEHWVDYNSNECAIYLMKFCGEYFRIDECGNNISMEKIEI